MTVIEGLTLRSDDYGTTVARIDEREKRSFTSHLNITIRADVTSTLVSCVDDNGTTDSISLRSLGRYRLELGTL